MWGWGMHIPPPADPEPTEEETEADRVRAWRVLQASELGYEWCDAVALADSDADMHLLADLIDHGCPGPLAARIV